MLETHDLSIGNAAGTLGHRDLYDYDCRGYLHVPGLIPPDLLARCSAFLQRPPDFSSDVTGIERWDDLYHRDPAVADLARAPLLLDRVKGLINQPIRIVESYGHRSFQGAFLYMHNGATQDLTYEGRIRASKNLAYRCEYHDGRLYTTYVKAILYLTDVDEEGGPFSYIEGSHKANFCFPWPEDVRAGRTLLSDSGHSGLRTVPVKAGDVIFLNEALLHGAARRRSAGSRALLAISYCPSFMADWGYLTRAPDDIETPGYPDLDDESDVFGSAPPAGA